MLSYNLDRKPLGPCKSEPLKKLKAAVCRKLSQNVAQIILYYHVTKHPCLNWLVTLFRFQNMFWKNIYCFQFWWRTQTWFLLPPLWWGDWIWKFAKILLGQKIFIYLWGDKPLWGELKLYGEIPEKYLWRSSALERNS